MRNSPALPLIMLLIVPAGAPQQASPQQTAPQNTVPQKPAPQHAPPIIRARSDLVVVPVTVKDGRGALVPDLERDDFRIFEDGIEQETSLFSAEAFPLSAVILIDNDLPAKTVDAVQRSLESISAGFGPNDETALVLFDQFSDVVLNFTKDNDQLFAQLKRFHLGSSLSAPTVGSSVTGPVINGRTVQGQVPSISKTSNPGKNIDDAVHDAAQMLRGRGRDRRKIIFLISDGNNSRQNKWSFDITRQLLLSQDISVYSVVTAPNLLKLDGGRLLKYANATGGDYFYATKQADLEPLYSRATEQARNQYTLAYVPHHNAKGRSYHAIEVRVRRPELKLLAREGYYTGPAR
jgi:Ca-activated chloride channel homolog